MNPPEHFYWRGWDCDSFFDDGVQAVLMQLHPHRVACKGKPRDFERPGNVRWDDRSKTLYVAENNGWEKLEQDAPYFHQAWGYPIASWKIIDQFRLANKPNDFELFDFELLTLLKLSPTWFFELGNAVYKWKNERAARYNKVSQNRASASAESALEYWHLHRPVHGATKVVDSAIRYEGFPPPGKFEAVAEELERLGFVEDNGPKKRPTGMFSGNTLCQCVKREDDRRRKIVEKWAQGFASALNCKVEATLVAGEAYKSYAAGPRPVRDRKR